METHGRPEIKPIDESFQGTTCLPQNDQTRTRELSLFALNITANNGKKSRRKNVTTTVQLIPLALIYDAEVRHNPWVVVVVVVGKLRRRNGGSNSARSARYVSRELFICGAGLPSNALLDCQGI